MMVRETEKKNAKRQRNVIPRQTEVNNGRRDTGKRCKVTTNVQGVARQKLTKRQKQTAVQLTKINLQPGWSGYQQQCFLAI